MKIQQKRNFKFYLLNSLVSVFIFSIVSGFGPCTTKTHETSAYIEYFKYYMGSPQKPNTAGRQALLDVIRSAKRELVAVLNNLTDTGIASALDESMLKILARA